MAAARIDAGTCADSPRETGHIACRDEACAARTRNDKPGADYAQLDRGRTPGGRE